TEKDDKPYWVLFEIARRHCSLLCIKGHSLLPKDIRSSFETNITFLLMKNKLTLINAVHNKHWHFSPVSSLDKTSELKGGTKLFQKEC
ncbi:hypothetical protein NPIL_218421, partial [Nephila pilipes]